MTEEQASHEEQPSQKNALPEERPEDAVAINEDAMETEGESQLEENINYVTPYAFGVSESIYGLPLAKPRKRLYAMIIDWIFIAMLTRVSYVIMFALYAALFLGLANRLKREEKSRFVRKVLRAVSFFCLFVFALGAIEYGFEWRAYLDTPQTSQTADSGDTELLEKTDTPQEREAPKLKDIDDYDWQWEKQPDKVSDEENTGQQPDTADDPPGDLMSMLEDTLLQYGISFGWAAFYFSVLVGFFSGQTPGKKLMNIKIIKQDGTDLTLWEAFGRYGGYGAGFATGLLGFLQVYWDPNRQAIQDKISGTLVIDTSKERVKL